MHERRGTEECGVDVVGAPRTGNRTFRSGNASEAERVPSAKRTQSDTLSPLRPVFEGKADVSKPPPPPPSAIREGYNTLRECKKEGNYSVAIFLGFVNFLRYKDSLKKKKKNKLRRILIFKYTSPIYFVRSRRIVFKIFQKKEKTKKKELDYF